MGSGSLGSAELIGLEHRLHKNTEINKWGTEYNNNNIFLNSSFHWSVEVNLF